MVFDRRADIAFGNLFKIIFSYLFLIKNHVVVAESACTPFVDAPLETVVVVELLEFVAAAGLLGTPGRVGIEPFGVEFQQAMVVGEMPLGVRQCRQACSILKY